MVGTGVEGPAVPVARRLRAPSWRDARLLVGLLLVLVSVAVGARVVAAADRTVPVYAARATLAPGTPLQADRLSVVRVRLTGTRAGYLDATRPVPAGQVVLRTVGPGEIVPVSGIGPAAALAARPVTVPLDGPAPEGLVTGGLADVWASARRRDGTGTGEFATPRRIARDVAVFHVTTPGDGLAAGRAAAVEVLLGEAELPLALDALANGARIAVVPVPGSAPGGRT